MYASDPIIFLLSNNFQPFPHDGSAGNKFLQLLFEKVFFARSLLKGNFAAYRILPTEVLHAPLFTSMVSEEKFNVFFPLLLSRSPPPLPALFSQGLSPSWTLRGSCRHA